MTREYRLRIRLRNPPRSRRDGRLITESTMTFDEEPAALDVLRTLRSMGTAVTAETREVGEWFTLDERVACRSCPSQ